jgi:CheY-like chemotaxis protein
LAKSLSGPLASGCEDATGIAPGTAPCPQERQPGILVVDDDASVRTMLEMGLRHHGFRSWLASEGQEALEIYKLHAPAIDVVLLDVRMPGLSGPETLEALRQLNPQVCCCFMSGESGGYTPEMLLALGAVRFLKKPFSLANVVSILWQLVKEVRPDASGETT